MLHIKNQQDLYAGGGLAAIGCFFLLYSIANYSVVTFSSMGPGFFPVFVSTILVILGLIISIKNVGVRSTIQADWLIPTSVIVPIIIFVFALPYTNWLLGITLLSFAISWLGKQGKISTSLTVVGINLLMLLLFKYVLKVQVIL